MFGPFSLLALIGIGAYLPYESYKQNKPLRDQQRAVAEGGGHDPKMAKIVGDCLHHNEDGLAWFGPDFQKDHNFTLNDLVILRFIAVRKIYERNGWKLNEAQLRIMGGCMFGKYNPECPETYIDEHGNCGKKL